jgi:excinuclease UvrABC ATPase subunit
MMAGVATTCDECEGKRFQAEVLEYEFGGKDISEVLAMPVAEAKEFFGAWRDSSSTAETPVVRRVVGAPEPGCYFCSGLWGSGIS